jgi:hypothetical protein
MRGCDVRGDAGIDRRGGGPVPPRRRPGEIRRALELGDPLRIVRRRLEHRGCGACHASSMRSVVGPVAHLLYVRAGRNRRILRWSVDPGEALARHVGRSAVRGRLERGRGRRSAVRGRLERIGSGSRRATAGPSVASDPPAGLGSAATHPTFHAAPARSAGRRSAFRRHHADLARGAGFAPAWHRRPEAGPPRGVRDPLRPVSPARRPLRPAPCARRRSRSGSSRASAPSGRTARGRRRARPPGRCRTGRRA